MNEALAAVRGYSAALRQAAATLKGIGETADASVNQGLQTWLGDSADAFRGFWLENFSVESAAGGRAWQSNSIFTQVISACEGFADSLDAIANGALQQMSNDERFIAIQARAIWDDITRIAGNAGQLASNLGRDLPPVTFNPQVTASWLVNSDRKSVFDETVAIATIGVTLATLVAVPEITLPALTIVAGLTAGASTLVTDVGDQVLSGHGVDWKGDLIDVGVKAGEAALTTMAGGLILGGLSRLASWDRIAWLFPNAAEAGLEARAAKLLFDSGVWTGAGFGAQALGSLVPGQPAWNKFDAGSSLWQNVAFGLGFSVLHAAGLHDIRTDPLVQISDGTNVLSKGFLAPDGKVYSLDWAGLRHEIAMGDLSNSVVTELSPTSLRVYGSGLDVTFDLTKPWELPANSFVLAGGELKEPLTVVVAPNGDLFAITKGVAVRAELNLGGDLSTITYGGSTIKLTGDGVSSLTVLSGAADGTRLQTFIQGDKSILTSAVAPDGTKLVSDAIVTDKGTTNIYQTTDGTWKAVDAFGRVTSDVVTVRDGIPFVNGEEVTGATIISRASDGAVLTTVVSDGKAVLVDATSSVGSKLATTSIGTDGGTTNFYKVGTGWKSVDALGQSATDTVGFDGRAVTVNGQVAADATVVTTTADALRLQSVTSDDGRPILVGATTAEGESLATAAIVTADASTNAFNAEGSWKAISPIGEATTTLVTRDGADVVINGATLTDGTIFVRNPDGARLQFALHDGTQQILAAVDGNGERLDALTVVSEGIGTLFYGRGDMQGVDVLGQSLASLHMSVEGANVVVLGETVIDGYAINRMADGATFAVAFRETAGGQARATLLRATNADGAPLETRSLTTAKGSSLLYVKGTEWAPMDAFGRPIAGYAEADARSYLGDLAKVGLIAGPDEAGASLLAPDAGVTFEVPPGLAESIVTLTHGDRTLAFKIPGVDLSPAVSVTSGASALDSAATRAASGWDIRFWEEGREYRWGLTGGPELVQDGLDKSSGDWVYSLPSQHLVVAVSDGGIVSAAGEVGPDLVDALRRGVTLPAPGFDRLAANRVATLPDGSTVEPESSLPSRPGDTLQMPRGARALVMSDAGELNVALYAGEPYLPGADGVPVGKEAVSVWHISTDGRFADLPNGAQVTVNGSDLMVKLPGDPVTRAFRVGINDRVTVSAADAPAAPAVVAGYYAAIQEAYVPDSGLLRHVWLADGTDLGYFDAYGRQVNVGASDLAGLLGGQEPEALLLGRTPAPPPPADVLAVDALTPDAPTNADLALPTDVVTGIWREVGVGEGSAVNSVLTAAADPGPAMDGAVQGVFARSFDPVELDRAGPVEVTISDGHRQLETMGSVPDVSAFHATDVSQAIDQQARQFVEWLLGGHERGSAITVQVSEMMPRGFISVFDRPALNIKFGSQVVAAIQTAFDAQAAGYSMAPTQVVALKEATEAAFHEWVHSTGVGDPSTSHPPPPPTRAVYNLEEGVTQRLARMWASAFLDRLGLSNVAPGFEDAQLSTKYGPQVALTEGFTEEGGHKLLGFQFANEFLYETARQDAYARVPWMADLIIDANGLARTEATRNALIQAIEDAFGHPLDFSGPDSAQLSNLKGRDAVDRIAMAVEELRSQPASPAGDMPAPSQSTDGPAGSHIDVWAQTGDANFGSDRNQAAVAAAVAAFGAQRLGIGVQGAAAEGALSVALTQRGNTALDLNVLMGHGQNFPLLDVASDAGFYSVKTHMGKARLSTYRRELRDLVMAYGKARNKLARAVALLDANRALLQAGHAWPPNLAVHASVVDIRAFLQANAMLAIPDDHVPAVRDAVIAAALDLPANYGLPASPSQADLDRLASRVVPVGIPSWVVEAVDLYFSSLGGAPPSATDARAFADDIARSKVEYARREIAKTLHQHIEPPAVTPQQREREFREARQQFLQAMGGGADAWGGVDTSLQPPESPRWRNELRHGVDGAMGGLPGGQRERGGGVSPMSVDAALQLWEDYRRGTGNNAPVSAVMEISGQPHVVRIELTPAGDLVKGTLRVERAQGIASVVTITDVHPIVEKIESFLGNLGYRESRIKLTWPQGPAGKTRMRLTHRVELAPGWGRDVREAFESARAQGRAVTVTVPSSGLAADMTVTAEVPWESMLRVRVGMERQQGPSAGPLLGQFAEIRRVIAQQAQALGFRELQVIEEEFPGRGFGRQVTSLSLIPERSLVQRIFKWETVLDSLSRPPLTRPVTTEDDRRLEELLKTGKITQLSGPRLYAWDVWVGDGLHLNAMKNVESVVWLGWMKKIKVEGADGAVAYLKVLDDIEEIHKQISHVHDAGFTAIAPILTTLFDFRFTARFRDWPRQEDHYKQIGAKVVFDGSRPLWIPPDRVAVEHVTRNNVDLGVTPSIGISLPGANRAINVSPVSLRMEAFYDPQGKLLLRWALAGFAALTPVSRLPVDPPTLHGPFFNLLPALADGRFLVVRRWGMGDDNAVELKPGSRAYEFWSKLVPPPPSPAASLAEGSAGPVQPSPAPAAASPETGDLQPPVSITTSPLESAMEAEALAMVVERASRELGRQIERLDSALNADLSDPAARRAVEAEVGALEALTQRVLPSDPTLHDQAAAARELIEAARTFLSLTGENDPVALVERAWGPKEGGGSAMAPVLSSGGSPPGLVAGLNALNDLQKRIADMKGEPVPTRPAHVLQPVAQPQRKVIQPSTPLAVTSSGGSGTQQVFAQPLAQQSVGDAVTKALTAFQTGRKQRRSPAAPQPEPGALARVKPSPIVEGSTGLILPWMPEQVLPSVLEWALGGGQVDSFEGALLSTREAEVAMLRRFFDPAQARELNYLGGQPSMRGGRVWTKGAPFEIATILKRVPWVQVPDGGYVPADGDGTRQPKGPMTNVLNQQVSAWPRLMHIGLVDGTRAWLLVLDHLREEKTLTRITQPFAIPVGVSWNDVAGLFAQVRWQLSEKETNDYRYYGAKVILGGVIIDPRGRRQRVGLAYLPPERIVRQYSHTAGWQFAAGFHVMLALGHPLLTWDLLAGGKVKLSPQEVADDPTFPEGGTHTEYQVSPSFQLLAPQVAGLSLPADQDFGLIEDTPEGTPWPITAPGVDLGHGLKLSQPTLNPVKDGKLSVLAIWFVNDRDEEGNPIVRPWWRLDTRTGIWRWAGARKVLDALSTKPVPKAPVTDGELAGALTEGREALLDTSLSAGRLQEQAEVLWDLLQDVAPGTKAEQVAEARDLERRLREEAWRRRNELPFEAVPARPPELAPLRNPALRGTSQALAQTLGEATDIFGLDDVTGSVLEELAARIDQQAEELAGLADAIEQLEVESESAATSTGTAREQAREAHAAAERLRQAAAAMPGPEPGNGPAGSPAHGPTPPSPVPAVVAAASLETGDLQPPTSVTASPLESAMDAALNADLNGAAARRAVEAEVGALEAAMLAAQADPSPERLETFSRAILAADSAIWEVDTEQVERLEAAEAAGHAAFDLPAIPGERELESAKLELRRLQALADVRMLMAELHAIKAGQLGSESREQFTQRLTALDTDLGRAGLDEAVLWDRENEIAELIDQVDDQAIERAGQAPPTRGAGSSPRMLGLHGNPLQFEAPFEHSGGQPVNTFALPAPVAVAVKHVIAYAERQLGGASRMREVVVRSDAGSQSWNEARGVIDLGQGVIDAIAAALDAAGSARLLDDASLRRLYYALYDVMYLAVCSVVPPFPRSDPKKLEDRVADMLSAGHIAHYAAYDLDAVAAELGLLSVAIGFEDLSLPLYGHQIDIHVVTSFAAAGGERLLGFATSKEYFRAQAAQPERERVAWMASQVRRTVGLPERSQRQVKRAVEKAFESVLFIRFQGGSYAGEVAFRELEREVLALVARYRRSVEPGGPQPHDAAPGDDVPALVEDDRPLDPGVDPVPDYESIEWSPWHPGGSGPAPAA